ncbi:MAG: protein kinase [Deltaproteobacteria bacterium]|nr:protein kinase [Deltaproteobacteria bacterium]
MLTAADRSSSVPPELDPDDDAPTMAARPSARSIPAPAPTVREAPDHLDDDSLDAPLPDPVTGSEPTSMPTASRVTLGGTRSGTGTSVVRTSREFLKQDEASRTHTFSTAMLLVVVAGGVCVGVLPTHVLARQIASVAMVVLGAGFLALWWHTRDVTKFEARFVGIVAQFLATSSVGMAYYFGVFSPFPCVVALALLVYALSAPAVFVVPCTILASGGHLLLTIAIVAGWIPDLGLVTADDAPFSVKLVGQGSVQLVYWTAFFVGRASNDRTRQRVRDMEAAVRQVAAREALLREARQELERAAGIGEAGRFTEQRLGPWVLGPILGRGGMGEIYEARHEETDRPAAVKLLLRGAYSDADPFERFAREARIAASLKSPHVVEILDIGGVEAPLPYIAMEHLRGEDLSSMLRSRRRLRPPELERLAREVALALEEAAGANIVHRDLKPSNVFYTTNGHWKVLDFGVSKLIGETGTLTAGNVVGTPAYMAPEQARGDEVDGRADVYSLAVILYRAMTGRPAFTGSDFAKMLRAVETQLPPAPSTLSRRIPEPVDHVLRIAMAKSPEDRFDGANELASALSRAFAGHVDEALVERSAKLREAIDWA